MKKPNLKITLSIACLGALVIGSIISSCKKEETTPVSSPGGSTIPPPPPPSSTFEITDGASLSKGLYIEGAVKKEGEIPAPESTQWGKTLDVITPQVVLTSGNIFDFEIESGSTAKVLFIKLDGTDEYFQVTVDANGNFLRGNGTTKLRQCCTPDGCKTFGAFGGVINTQINVEATVQIYEPPLQGTAPDLSFLNDWNYWSPPKRITYKCFPTGTGDVFVTLTWNKEGDVDLWLKEPNGNKIYYANEVSSTGGELDYDNTVEYGPENIFYNNTPPSGNYEVWLHYYSERVGPTDWVITLKNGSSIDTYRGTLVNDNDSVLVKSFTR